MRLDYLLIWLKHQLFLFLLIFITLSFYYCFFLKKVGPPESAILIYITMYTVYSKLSKKPLSVNDIDNGVFLPAYLL